MTWESQSRTVAFCSDKNCMEMTEAGYLHPLLKIQIDYTEYQQVPTRH